MTNLLKIKNILQSKFPDLNSKPPKGWLGEAIYDACPYNPHRISIKLGLMFEIALVDIAKLKIEINVAADDSKHALGFVNMIKKNI